MISCSIAVSKPDIVDLTTFGYQHIYISFLAYFVDKTVAPPVQIFSKVPTIDIALPSDFFYPFFTDMNGRPA
ncbi:unnamed protein product [Gongylonema pulchrum]|uniref:Uncharacterized protein n=1 Tax=Gongylonema pulchrum TaxID=637853 RepID=A0A3P6TRL2_9BILA|nr:unnamed protein product [Gongylonema pulchrum]